MSGDNMKLFLASLVGLYLLSFSAIADTTTLKAGWNKTIIENQSRICLDQMLESAERGYYGRAKEVGDSNPKPFPTEQLTESMRPLCTCIYNKASQTWSLVDFENNEDTYIERMLDTAMRGGDCRPQGILGKAVK